MRFPPDNPRRSSQNGESAFIALVVAIVAIWPAAVWAQTAPGAAPPLAPADVAIALLQRGRLLAEALYTEAKDLRDAGHYAEACSKFTESRALANGVGVTLDLAECHEKVGKTQSAWTEFRKAEKLARERNDRRADVAAARALALEPRLNRVTLALPVAAGQAAPEVAVDGVAVPADQLNAAFAMDPGDHEVTVTAAGQPARVVPIHVEPKILSLVVPLGELAAATALQAAEPPASTPAAETIVSPVDPGAGRRWGGLGLIASGAGASAVATWLLTTNVADCAPGGQPCDSHLRGSAVPEAAVLYSLAGVAAVTGVVLMITAPHHVQIAMSPLALPGGGGALLRWAF